MRVALIGPVPPELGGATHGGVATHQVHLAAGLAAAGIHAPLLATNTRVPAWAWHAAHDEAPFPLYRMSHADVRPRTLPPRSLLPRGVLPKGLLPQGVLPKGRAEEPWSGLGEYLRSVGYVRLVRYALSLSRERVAGSRRDVLGNLLWYRRFVAEVQPEVIHVQHPLERCQYVRLLQRFERWRMPLVVTAHSLFGEHADATIQTLMAPNLRAANRVIAVSDHIADQAVSLGVAPENVSVIRSGVDLDRFVPRDRHVARGALQIGDATPLVLFVGNLEPRKQVDVLLRAFVRVRQAVPGAVGLIVGSGESAGIQDQTARLVRLTHDLELNGAVRFVGRAPDQQLLNYYAAADVFALPSSSEAQGIVALEAMASGLPVVASAVGGLLGTIADGETGVLVPPGDVASLAERLTELLQNPARRAAMASAARRSVEQNFSWRRAAEATIAVYREVLACQKR